VALKGPEGSARADPTISKDIGADDSADCVRLTGAVCWRQLTVSCGHVCSFPAAQTGVESRPDAMPSGRMGADSGRLRWRNKHGSHSYSNAGGANAGRHLYADRDRERWREFVHAEANVECAIDNSLRSTWVVLFRLRA
jgi:hypothetical protein